MNTHPNWKLSESKKKELISALTDELVLLRTRAEISQEELAALVGTSRQTYGAIERKTRRMSWSMFLSLILFFDYNQKTHQMLRSIGVFPHEIINHFNGGSIDNSLQLSPALNNGMESIIASLDEQALHSIRTLIMVEYARCTDTPGEVVVKAFDGRNFNPTDSMNQQITLALKTLRNEESTDDNQGN